MFFFSFLNFKEGKCYSFSGGMEWIIIPLYDEIVFFFLQKLYHQMNYSFIFFINLIENIVLL